MNEQQLIAHLLTPRVMVTNEWPAPSTHSEEFKVGQVITEGPMYIMIWGRQYTAVELCAKYKGNFRLLDWWEEREKSELPKYVAFDGLMHKVKKWWKNAFDKWVCDTAESRIRAAWQTLPATSAQYLEYLNQQSKG